MNKSQKASLAALLEVECKMAEGGAEDCDGPWCTARQSIITAFKLAKAEEKAEEKSSSEA